MHIVHSPSQKQDPFHFYKTWFVNNSQFIWKEHVAFYILPFGELHLKGLGFFIHLASQQCGKRRDKATLELVGVLFACHGLQCFENMPIHLLSSMDCLWKPTIAVHFRRSERPLSKLPIHVKFYFRRFLLMNLKQFWEVEVWKIIVRTFLYDSLFRFQDNRKCSCIKKSNNQCILEFISFECWSLKLEDLLRYIHWCF